MDNDKIIKIVMNELNNYIANTVNNEDKWITIKPHGKDSDDYRRLNIKEGETVDEAMERKFGIRQAKGQQHLLKKSEYKIDKQDKKEDTLEKRKKVNAEYRKAIIEYEKINQDFNNGKISFDDWEKANKKMQKVEKEYRENPIFTEKQREQDTKQEPKKEEKTYTFKDKNYTAKQLVDEGFHPIKYDKNFGGDIYFIKKQDKVERIKINDDDYNKIKKYHQNKLQENIKKYKKGELVDIIMPSGEKEKIETELTSWKIKDFKKNIGSQYFKDMNTGGKIINPYYNLEKAKTKEEFEEKVKRGAKEYLKKHPDYDPHQDFIKRQKANNSFKHTYIEY